MGDIYFFFRQSVKNVVHIFFSPFLLDLREEEMFWRVIFLSEGSLFLVQIRLHPELYGFSYYRSELCLDDIVTLLKSETSVLMR